MKLGKMTRNNGNTNLSKHAVTQQNTKDVQRSRFRITGGTCQLWTLLVDIIPNTEYTGEQQCAIPQNKSLEWRSMGLFEYIDKFDNNLKVK